MKLILLYGPPAAGKLTVAKELSKKTGIILFHSHMILNDIAQVFGYDNPVRRNLEFEFKSRIMEEAIKQNKDLITTGSITRENRHYYENLINMVKISRGKILLVHVIANRKALEERIIHESRSQKINTTEKLGEFLNKYPENLEKFGKGDQLVLDTSDISPKKSAEAIAEHFSLL